MTTTRNNTTSIFPQVWKHIHQNQFTEALAILATFKGKPNQSYLVAQATCYAKTGQPQLALETISKINLSKMQAQHLSSYDNLLRTQAACHHDLKNHQAELETLLKIIRPSELDIIFILHAYKKIKQFELAIQYSEQLPANLKRATKIKAARYSIKLDAAHFYSEQGNFLRANEICLALPERMTEQTVINRIVSNYENMGQFDLAIQFLIRLPAYQKNDTNILKLLAHAYKQQNQYHQAIACYERIEDYANNQAIQTLIGICKQALGDEEGALAAFMATPHWYCDKHNLISLAIYYSKLGNIDLAGWCLQRIPNHQTDLTVQVTLARCYSEVKSFEQAIATIEAIHGWQENNKALLTLARIYQERFQFGHALQIYHTIPAEQQTIDVRLAIANCLSELVTEEALLAYQNLLADYPQNPIVAQQYAKFLVQKQISDAHTLLQSLIKQHPHVPQLYLQAAKLAQSVGDAARAKMILAKLTFQHPHFPAAQLALIALLLEVGEDQQASAQIAYCRQLFQGDFVFEKKLQRILKFSFVMDHHNASLQPVETVVMNEATLAAFALFNDLPAQAFLAGSSVHALLEKRSLPTDLDFIITLSNPALLIEKGFVQSQYNARLFTRFYQGRMIDCYLNQPAIEAENEATFFIKDAAKRDFTKNTLICDKHGHIVDPTHLGREDLATKTLRTVGHAEQRLENNPVLILRAVKNMVEGYTPDTQLMNALYTWDSHIPDEGHLKAVLRKHFKQLDMSHYIQVLQDLRLLEKLFNIPNHTPYEQAYSQLSDYCFNQSIRERSVSIDDSLKVNYKNPHKTHYQLFFKAVQAAEFGSTRDDIDLALHAKGLS